MMKSPEIQDLIRQHAQRLDAETPPVGIDELRGPAEVRGLAELPLAKPKSGRTGLLRGSLVAAGAALAVLVAVGGGLLLFNVLPGNDGPVTTAPPVATTVTPSSTTTPPVTTTIAPTTSTRAPQAATTITLALRDGVRRYTVAADSGQVWVSVDGAVQRLDPLTGEVEAALALDDARTANIVLAGGDVWVAHGDTLSRVDGETAQRTATVALQPIDFRIRPLAVGEGSVWVTSGHDVVRVDPDTARVTGRVRFEGSAAGVVTGAGAVWALVDESVVRVHPVTLQTATLIADIPSIFYPRWGTPLHFGHDTLWIHAGGLARIDPVSGASTQIVSAGPDCCGPLGVAFAPGQVIASSVSNVHSVVSIDLDTQDQTTVLNVNLAVFALSVDGDALWAAPGAAGNVRLYRIELTGP